MTIAMIQIVLFFISSAKVTDFLNKNARYVNYIIEITRI
jgi:hypothetical protein